MGLRDSNEKGSYFPPSAPSELSVTLHTERRNTQCASRSLTQLKQWVIIAAPNNYRGTKQDITRRTYGILGIRNPITDRRIPLDHWHVKPLNSAHQNEQFKSLRDLHRGFNQVELSLLGITARAYNFLGGLERSVRSELFGNTTVLTRAKRLKVKCHIPPEPTTRTPKWTFQVAEKFTSWL